jgi:hypothetical protein
VASKVFIFCSEGHSPVRVIKAFKPGQLSGVAPDAVHELKAGDQSAKVVARPMRGECSPGCVRPKRLEAVQGAGRTKSRRWFGPGPSAQKVQAAGPVAKINTISHDHSATPSTPQLVASRAGRRCHGSCEEIGDPPNRKVRSERVGSARRRGARASAPD